MLIIKANLETISVPEFISEVWKPQPYYLEFNPFGKLTFTLYNNTHWFIPYRSNSLPLDYFHLSHWPRWKVWWYTTLCQRRCAPTGTFIPYRRERTAAWFVLRMAVLTNILNDNCTRVFAGASLVIGQKLETTATPFNRKTIHTNDSMPSQRNTLLTEG